MGERVRRSIGGRAMFLVATEADFAELHDKVSQFKNPAEPSSVEKAMIWQRAIELFNGLIQSGRDHTRTKILRCSRFSGGMLRA